MSHLFLFTIGPVQSFIATARKTVDLNTGSRLLTELCRKACEKTKDLGGEIVFPNINNDSLPNRFIAIFNDDNNDWSGLGSKVEDHVRACFTKIGDDVIGNNRKPDNFDRQIKNHLDIHWVFNPIGLSYRNSYKEIERILSSIKNERKFKQLEEKGRKCSIDGVGNALFYLNDNKRKPFAIQKDALEIGSFIKDSKLDIMFNPKESFSAVSFIKRVYKFRNISFPSTANIALMQTLNNKALETDIRDYKKLFNGKFDEQFFFEENLTDEYFKKHSLGALHLSLNEIINTQTKFRKKVKDANLSFSSYYALMLFDGDNMGKWFSGEYLDQSESLQNYQMKLSEILGDFGNNAINQIKEPFGATVYAGGDDYLGFLNLDNLFYSILSLRELFEKEVNKRIKRFNGVRSDENLNFSAGIVIAHYKMPLSEVLNFARKLEKKSKEHSGKNAFTIGVIKHSGTIEQCTYKWKRDERYTSKIFQRIVDQLANGNFSTNFVKNLYREFYLMRDDINKKWVISEVNRLLKQSFNLNETNMDRKREIINEMSENLQLLLEESIDKGNVDKEVVDFENFISSLNVCDFICRNVSVNPKTIN